MKKIVKSVTAAFIAVMAFYPSISVSKDIDEIHDLSEQMTVQINSPASVGGSGFIIAKEESRYTVLTANHVVCMRPLRGTESCDETLPFTIKTHSGKEYPLTVVKRFTQDNTSVDMAIATFDSQGQENLPVATLGDASFMELGSTVYSVGFPAENGNLGERRNFEIREGYIITRINHHQGSGYDRGYRLRYASRTTVGMSGGPVFDYDGRVIGIHGWGSEVDITDSINNENRGLKGAIPINTFAEWCAVNRSCPDLNMDNKQPTEEPTERLRNPKSARDFLIVALGKHANHQYATAISTYSEALRINPYYADAFRHRGLAYTQQNQYQQAIQDWNNAIENGYVTADIYCDRGLAYSRINNLEDAEQDYRQALQYDASYFRAHRGLGDVHAEQEQFDLAIESYSKALENYSKDGYTYFNRAIAFNNLGTQYYQQGNLQDALSHLENALLDLNTASPLLLDSHGGRSLNAEVRMNIREVEDNIDTIKQQIPTRNTSLNETPIPREEAPNTDSINDNNGWAF